MATLNHPRKAGARDGLCFRWAGSPWKRRRSEPTRTGTGPATVDGPSQSPNDDRTPRSQASVSAGRSLTEQGHTPIKHERMFVEADPERKTHVTRGEKTHVVHPSGSRLIADVRCRLLGESLGSLAACFKIEPNQVTRPRVRDHTRALQADGRSYVLRHTARREGSPHDR